MRCFVTAGPTWEPLDRVRRLTNSSTGSLGGELANHLARAGHEVTLFLGETAVWRSPLAAVKTVAFATTESLAALFREEAGTRATVIFHAAAVSDFTGGAAGQFDATGGFQPLSAGKLPTRAGNLWLELRPTLKILPQLADWFPHGRIVGWKYEVDGDREAALTAGLRQLRESRTHACVVNGPAYGEGFGLLRPDLPLGTLADRPALFAALEVFATG